MYCGADEECYGVLSSIDDLLLSEDFEGVAKTLKEVIVKDTSDVLLICYLLPSCHGQEHYKEAYTTFYNEAFVHIEDSGEDAQDLIGEFAPKDELCT